MLYKEKLKGVPGLFSKRMTAAIILLESVGWMAAWTSDSGFWVRPIRVWGNGPDSVGMVEFEGLVRVKLDVFSFRLAFIWLMAGCWANNGIIPPKRIKISKEEQENGRWEIIAIYFKKSFDFFCLARAKVAGQ